MLKTVSSLKHSGKSIGFVPTLGALHDGHLSLIKKAKKENDIVVVSVFVNRLQFRKMAFLNYPRNLKGDAAIAKKAGADILFAPSEKQIYPNGFSAQVVLPNLFKALKSQKLSWHYKGVLIVVMKLFNIVNPTRAYFGLKDPHQFALIKKMVDDFNMQVKICGCPTVRGRDRLALSSRNALLSGQEKKAAKAIYRALVFAKTEMKKNGAKSATSALAGMKKMLKKEAPAVQLDYAEIADAKTLEPLWGKSKEALVFVAAFVGGKRLTDNIRLNLRQRRKQH